MSAPNIQIICRCHTILGFLALTRRRCRPRICSLALPVSAPAYVCLCVYMCLCLHPIEWQNSMFKCVWMCVCSMCKKQKISNVTIDQMSKYTTHEYKMCCFFAIEKKKPARVEIMTNILSNECKNVKYTCLWNTIQQTLIKSTGKFTYVCVCASVLAAVCVFVCCFFSIFRLLILSRYLKPHLPSRSPLSVPFKNWNFKMTKSCSMITNFEGYHQFCGVAFNKSNQHRHDFASLRNDKNVPKQPKNLITSNHERN